SRTLDFGRPGLPDLRTFDAGITYHGLEVANIMLGQGNDSITVENTVTYTALGDNGNPALATGTLTVVHGGGGSDTLTVTGGGGTVAPLILLGDTTQDGTFYNSTTESVNAWNAKLPGAVLPLGRIFPAAGNDIINALNASGMVTIYGGSGNDTITGSSYGDHIAGGSGDNTINGKGGNDHIYGDAGFNLNLSKRLEQATLSGQQVLLVTNNDAASLSTRDQLAPGGDTINANAGDDIVFGDYGTIAQATFTQRLVSTDRVERAETVNPTSGGADNISGNEGDDLLFGGHAGDTIAGNEDDNVILGDSGAVDFVVADGDRADIDEIVSTSTIAGGGSDVITANGGQDIIIGGRFNDTINAGEGDNLVIGDSGRIRAAVQNAPQMAGQRITLGRVETSEFDDGGADGITTGTGNDIVLGGDEGDTINAGEGNNIVLGDNG